MNKAKKHYWFYSSALLIAIIIFFIATETGFNWSFPWVKRLIPGELQVEQISGRWLGPITSHQLKYQFSNTQVSIEAMSLDWDSTALLLGRLNIDQIKMKGVSLSYTQTSQPPRHEPITLPVIRVPLPIQINHFKAENIHIQVNNTQFDFPILDFNAKFVDSVLTITELHTTFNQLNGFLSGTVNFIDDYPIDIKNRIVFRSQDYQINSQGTLHGGMNRLSINQQLTGDMLGQFVGLLQDTLTQPKWRANLEATRFSVKNPLPSFLGDQVTGHIYVEGQLESQIFKGQLTAPSMEYGAINTEFEIVKNAESWRIDKLLLNNPAVESTAQAQGQWKEGWLSLEGQWRNILLPPSLAKIVLFSEAAQFSLKTNFTRMDFNVKGDLVGESVPKTHVVGQALLENKQLTIPKLDLDFSYGSIAGILDLSWHDGLNWSSDFNVTRFNPGEIWPELSGSISAQVKSAGKYQDALFMSLDIANIGGKLNNAPLAGKFKAEFHNDQFNIQDCTLKIGSSKILIAGSKQKLWDLSWHIDIDHLNTLSPKLRGSLDSTGEITGPITTPHFTTETILRSLQWQNTKIKSALLNADVAFDKLVQQWAPFEVLNALTQSQLKIAVSELQHDSLKLDQILLDLQGDTGNHQAQLHLKSPLINLALQASGIKKNQQWSEQITAIKLNMSQFGQWQAATPGTITIDHDKISFEKLCLSTHISSLCHQGSWQEQTGFKGAIQLKNFSLALLSDYLPKNLYLSSEISQAAFSYEYKKSLKAELNADISQGQLTYLLPNGEYFSIEHQNAKIVQTLAHNQLHSSLQIPLKEGIASVAGTIPITDLNNNNIALYFYLDMTDIKDLITLLPELENTHGQLRLTANIDGPWKAPRITTNLIVTEATTTIPRLGIQLKNVQLNAYTNKQEQLLIQGKMSSKDGNVHLEGNFNLNRVPEELSGELRITGSNFQMLHIPEYSIWLTPDVTIKVYPALIDIGGTIQIPQARFEPRNLNTAKQVSQDEIIQQELTPQERILKIRTRVKLVLGDEVKFKGFGLESKIKGSIIYKSEKNSATTASGELTIEQGTYNAIAFNRALGLITAGQKLNIEKGRIIFADSPLNDPALDLKALRKINDVTVGIHLRGRLSQPDNKLISEPAMDNTDIVSYMLFGLPLGNISQDQGKDLQNSAVQLGIVGGEFLAQKIGKRFGIDTIRLEQNKTTATTTGALNENISLVIGKYLSPNLYISYGAGLLEKASTFNLRYQMSKRWSLEASHGLESGGDLFYNVESNGRTKK